MFGTSLPKTSLTWVASIVGVALVVAAQLVSTASNLTGRWVARVPNGDGTFRETVFALKQEGATLTGTVINPTSEQPFVEGSVSGDTFTFASAPVSNPRRAVYRGTLEGDELALTIVRPGRPDQMLSAT